MWVAVCFVVLFLAPLGLGRNGLCVRIIYYVRRGHVAKETLAQRVAATTTAGADK